MAKINCQIGQVFWGENQGKAAIYGWAIIAIVSVLLTTYISSKAILALIVFLLATFLLVSGSIILKGLKKIRKLIR